MLCSCIKQNCRWKSWIGKLIFCEKKKRRKIWTFGMRSIASPKRVSTQLKDLIQFSPSCLPATLPHTDGIPMMYVRCAYVSTFLHLCLINRFRYCFNVWMFVQPSFKNCWLKQIFISSIVRIFFTHCYYLRIPIYFPACT